MELPSLLYVSRRVEFAAAHRLFRADWTEAANRDVFGQCANPHGHGHNYELEVTVAGRPNPETGMVIHFQELKRILQEEVLAPLDHRHMNHDVPFLAGILPTSENVIRILWERLSNAAEAAQRGKSGDAEDRWTLYRLRLTSTPRNIVEYYGPGGP